MTDIRLSGCILQCIETVVYEYSLERKQKLWKKQKQLRL